MLHFAKQHSPDSLRAFLSMRKTQITDNWPILGFLQALHSSYIANPFLFPYTIPSGGGMMRRRFWGRGKASTCNCSHVLVPGCHLPHHLSPGTPLAITSWTSSLGRMPSREWSGFIFSSDFTRVSHSYHKEKARSLLVKFRDFGFWSATLRRAGSLTFPRTDVGSSRCWGSLQAQQVCLLRMTSSSPMQRSHLHVF